MAVGWSSRGLQSSLKPLPIVRACPLSFVDMGTQGDDRVNDMAEVDRLALLRDRWRARLDHRRCLIIGSAPGAVAPDLAGIDTVICVNGSPWVARRLGIERPDITVVAGFATLGDNKVRRATTAALRGLSTDEVLFVEAGMNMQRGRHALDEAGFAYRHFTSITVHERAAIIEAVCGEPLGLGKRDERISNGIFAVVLAIWGSASDVVLAGFSIAGGHAYIPGETLRHHLRGDGRFLSLTGRFGCRVSTTAPELGTMFGIARCDGVVPSGAAGSC